jgi:hypothetical protein
VSLDTQSRDFLVGTNTCGSSLAPQASCFADVFFQPTGFGPRVGQLRVNSISLDTGQVVDLAGSGCRPYVPTSIRSRTTSSCTP